MTCPTCAGTRTVRLYPCLDCAPRIDLTVANILEADRAWRRPRQAAVAETVTTEPEPVLSDLETSEAREEIELETETMTDAREEEIDAILWDMESLWKKHPHMRLGQLLVCLAAGSTPGLFYMEDSQLAKQIDAKIEGGPWPLSSDYAAGPEFKEA